MNTDPGAALRYLAALMFIEWVVLPRIAALQEEQARFDREFWELVAES